MSFVYLDTETTGLDPERHQIWEIAFAVDDGPIQSGTVTHRIDTADPKALEINHYEERVDKLALRLPAVRAMLLEASALHALTGATLVGANPAFDAAFLRARWHESPWKYRLLDIEAFAMPGLGLHEPRGIAYIAEALGVQAPDHTAAGDVHTLRECHRELLDLYNLSEGK